MNRKEREIARDKTLEEMAAQVKLICEKLDIDLESKKIVEEVKEETSEDSE